jgi:hypothetical protein
MKMRIVIRKKALKRGKPATKSAPRTTAKRAKSKVRGAGRRAARDVTETKQLFYKNGKIVGICVSNFRSSLISNRICADKIPFCRWQTMSDQKGLWQRYHSPLENGNGGCARAVPHAH